MTRLIDADKAERDIEELRESDWFNAPYLSKERKIGLSEAFDMIQGVCIKHAPTVDAEPVRHGKWIKLDMHAHLADHKCTACGQECYVPTCMGEPMYTYCPNCGAKMDGDKHESD